MYSVTKRIASIKQPYGGYLRPKDMEEIQLNDGKVLGAENLNPSIVGTAVDYLTRYRLGASKEEAFAISLAGAEKMGAEDDAFEYLMQLRDKESDACLIAACKLVGYDACFRAGVEFYVPVETPDAATIQNIRIMVERSLTFFREYGPITMDGPTFEGGYTKIVSSGDGDFVTGDTVWDFKVSKSKPTSAHTLQLIMYYLMGKRSIHKEFDSVRYIGIFNPRQNVIYRYDMNNLPKEIVQEIERDVIGY